MGECKVGFYANNIVVTHGAFVCYGGLGQPSCKHLDACAHEHGVKLRVKRVSIGQNRAKKRLGRVK